MKPFDQKHQLLQCVLMPNPLDISLLQTLVAIADHDGFARAGQHVNLSQSTVSLQMKRLEEQVAAPLFVKHGRRMVLTEEGLSLVRYARRILALDHEARTALAGAQFAGPVRLGMIQDLTEQLLTEILAKFAHSNPDVRLEIKVGTSQELKAALASGLLDLALVAGQQGRSTPLFRREKLFWIGSDRHAIAPERPVPLAVCTEPCGVRQMAIELLEKENRPWRIALSCPSLEGIRAAVRAGLGITLRGKALLEPGLTPLEGVMGLPSPRHFDIVLARADNPSGSEAVIALDKLITSFAESIGSHRRSW